MEDLSVKAVNLIHFNVVLLILNILEIGISRRISVESSVSLEGKDYIYHQRLLVET